MDKITIIRFQLLVHQLLKVHYGITLSDTGLLNSGYRRYRRSTVWWINTTWIN